MEFTSTVPFRMNLSLWGGKEAYLTSRNTNHRRPCLGNAVLAELIVLVFACP